MIRTAEISINLSGTRPSHIRFITEGLGAAIQWDEVTRAVDIRLGENEIRLVMGESEAIVNGQVVAFDTSPVIIQGRTFVPLRFISEALGASVNWEGPSQTHAGQRRSDPF